MHRKSFLWFPVYLLRRHRFTLAGREYPCFYHWYNRTWMNERSVEIPIVRGWLADHPGGRLLEVGNVLGHYGHRGHDVVDRYERARGVRNEDVATFAPNHPYDRIVSISTLEHVGIDEEPRDPEKAGHAIRHLATLLAPGGEMLVTLPLGYHPRLDEMVAGGELPFTQVHYLRRIDRENHWTEVEPAEAKTVRYGDPFYAANGLAVCFLTRR